MRINFKILLILGIPLNVNQIKPSLESLGQVLGSKNHFGLFCYRINQYQEEFILLLFSCCCLLYGPIDMTIDLHLIDHVSKRVDRLATLSLSFSCSCSCSCSLTLSLSLSLPLSLSLNQIYLRRNA